MAGITSPYNFVPLPAGVFFPNWADKVSHDVPFSDGLTGKICLTLTAETPIFVRNGAAQKDDKEGKKEKSFSHDADGRYFIPGTSIKGAVRSILEILSYGKMRLARRAMFAQREWDNPNLYPIKAPAEQQKIKCGYLRRNGSSYVIESHGKPWRISQPNIDAMLGANVLRENFSRNGVGSPDLPDEQKTAEYKYSLLTDQERAMLLNQSFRVTYNNKTYKDVATPDAHGDKVGSVVLTGSPNTWEDVRKAGGGKYYEFVFPKDIKEK